MRGTTSGKAESEGVRGTAAGWQRGGGQGFGGEVGEILICGLAARGGNFTLLFSIWKPEIFTLPADIHIPYHPDMFVHSKI